MPKIATQADLNRARKNTICYICGKAIDGHKSSKNRDHIPPRCIFDKADRANPLILETHTNCNEGESHSDERIGQLLALLHGNSPPEEFRHLTLTGAQDLNSTKPFAILEGINIENNIKRWIRGFHFALYGEYLPNETAFNILAPVPKIKQIDGSYVFESVAPQYALYVEHLKKNRKTDTIDSIIAFNQKCRYECTWDMSDRGEQWLCIFGLQIYDWSQMAKDTPVGSRGCVGAYFPNKGCPYNAAKSTNLEFEVPNIDTLNPFGG